MSGCAGMGPLQLIILGECFESEVSMLLCNIARKKINTQRHCVMPLPCSAVDRELHPMLMHHPEPKPSLSRPIIHALLCDPASCNHLFIEHCFMVLAMPRKCQLILFLITLVIFNNFITTAFLGLLLTISRLATSRTLTTPEIDIIIVILDWSG